MVAVDGLHAAQQCDRRSGLLRSAGLGILLEWTEDWPWWDAIPDRSTPLIRPDFRPRSEGETWSTPGPFDATKSADASWHALRSAAWLASSASRDSPHSSWFDSALCESDPQQRASFFYDWKTKNTRTMHSWDGRERRFPRWADWLRKWVNREADWWERLDWWLP